MVLPLSEKNILDKASSLCLKNAKQHIKDAELLYSFKSYGHALALTVLSDVEIGKTAIFNLWSKNLIKEEILPPSFQPIFQEKNYDLFASQTWFIGFVVASNVHELVQEVIDASEEAGDFTAKGELSGKAKKRISAIIESMTKNSKMLGKYEEYLQNGFFVNLGVKEEEIKTPGAIEKDTS